MGVLGPSTVMLWTARLNYMEVQGGYLHFQDPA